MSSRIRHLVYAALPIGAVLALAGGPSVTAAYAECRARVAEEHKAKQKTLPTNQGSKGRAASLPSSHGKPGTQPEKRACEAAFVAPEAAKPTGGETWQFESSADNRLAHDLAPIRHIGETPVDLHVRVAALHCPAYLAQAPPRP